MSQIKTKVDPFGGRQNRVIPSLIAHDATLAIEFYKKVFDAKVTYMTKIDNKIPHAELVIGNTTLMISDEIYG